MICKLKAKSSTVSAVATTQTSPFPNEDFKYGKEQGGKELENDYKDASKAVFGAANDNKGQTSVNSPVLGLASKSS